jgi:DNA-binding response OmpR family regulator
LADALPPHVLLVDDDPAVLELVREALTAYGMNVHAHSDGRRALDQLASPDAPPFDLVISDINMEGFDGFDVIHRVKTMKPHLPVVLMTGAASVEYTIRAMRMGAANLFVKPLSLRDMVKSVFHLVDLHREFRLAQTGLQGLVKETREFRFRSDQLDIPSLIKHLTDRLVALGLAQAANLDTIAMAYHEALVNSLDHGNLELDSSLKGDLLDDEDPYQALRRERLANPMFAARGIQVRTSLDPQQFLVEIEDEGKGFDTRKAGPTSHSDLVRQCGRGLPLIQTIMDEVSFNEKGNAIRMVLRRKGV